MKAKYLFFLASALFMLFTMHAQEVNEVMADSTASPVSITRMFNTSELSTDDGRLLTVDGLGLFYFDRGTLVSLDSISCPDISMCRLKINIEYDDLVMCDGHFIVKSGPFVIMLDGDRSCILSLFDTEEFYIYRGGDDYINIVIPEINEEWAWYTLNVSTGKLDCITRMPTPITKVIDTLNCVFLVCESTIYIVTEEGVNPFLTCNRNIIDATATGYGLYVMTDSALYLSFGDNEEPTKIIENEMYGLYSDGDVVYIVTKDGEVMRLAIKFGQ